MKNLFLLLDFFPGYKRQAGALMLVGVAVGAAYNSFAVPSFGVPAIPSDWLVYATVTGNAVLGTGVASAAVR